MCGYYGSDNWNLYSAAAGVKSYFALFAVGRCGMSADKLQLFSFAEVYASRSGYGSTEAGICGKCDVLSFFLPVYPELLKGEGHIFSDAAVAWH